MLIATISILHSDSALANAKLTRNETNHTQRKKRLNRSKGTRPKSAPTNAIRTLTFNLKNLGHSFCSISRTRLQGLLINPKPFTMRA